MGLRAVLVLTLCSTNLDGEAGQDRKVLEGVDGSRPDFGSPDLPSQTCRVRRGKDPCVVPEASGVEGSPIWSHLAGRGLSAGALQRLLLGPPHLPCLVSWTRRPPSRNPDPAAVGPASGPAQVSAVLSPY